MRFGRATLDEAKTEIAESRKLKPEVNSVSTIRVLPSFGNRQFQALIEKTLYAGLRRAGFPDE